jgi:hypothetical protein
MKRISTSTKAVDLFGAGKHGWRNGDLSTGVQPTDAEADWFNHLQEEVANVIEANGIALNGADRTQLYQAIQLMIAGTTNNGLKLPVRFTTTGNIVLSGLGTQAGGDWGAALTAGDRVLPKDQTTGADRGIYIAAAGAWTRATDANGAGELIPGALVVVSEGVTQADSIWELATDGPITIGTTALVFTKQGGSTAATGFRNKIINGAMMVDQRNAGAFQTFTAGAALAYSVDRWYGFCSGANITGQQVAGAIANTYRYQFGGAVGNTGFGFGTRLEAANTAMLAGSTATLSAKLKSSSLTTITWTAYYANTKETFGTLASPTRTQIATGSFTINATEATYSAQLAVPGAATTGIEVVFTGGALLSGQTASVTEVQLEQAASASAFERLPYGLDLSLCQRYGLGVPVGGVNQNGWTGVGGAPISNASVQFPVTMRATPSVPSISWTLSQASTPTATYLTNGRVDWQVNGTVTNGTATASNSAAFFLSAEL